MSTPQSTLDESQHLDSERDEERDPCLEEKMSCLASDLSQHSALATPPGISRQQLINRYQIVQKIFEVHLKNRCRCRAMINNPTELLSISLSVLVLSVATKFLDFITVYSVANHARVFSKEPCKIGRTTCV